MRELPGDSGIVKILFATGTLGVAWLVLYGAWLHALACGAAVVVGLLAVQVINRV